MTDSPSVAALFAGASLDHHAAAVQALVASGDTDGAVALLEEREPATLRLLCVLFARAQTQAMDALGMPSEQFAGHARAAAAHYSERARELAAELAADDTDQ